ncbi:MAG: ABC transporter ATP-binding protein [Clostridia bacterium]|nr:ABC transporter ATP-binding protein [Clostridia bacterium]
MNKSSKISLIRKFLKGSVHLFVLSMAATLLVSIFELIYPQIIRLLTDSIIGNETVDPDSVAGFLVTKTFGIEFLKSNLWMIAVIIIGFALFIGIFKYLSGVLNTAASEKLTETTRNNLFDRIEHLPFSWHTANPTGDIIQRCTSDVETLKRFLSEQLTQVVSTFLLIVLSLFFLAEIHPKFAIIAGLSIPLVVGFSGCFHKLISKGFAKCDENEGILSSIVQENLTGVRVVRAFGREKAEIEKFTNQNNTYTNTWIKLCRVLASFWATNDIISCVQVMVVIVTGVYLCVDGDITAGDFIAAVSYNATLTWPVRRLGRMISEMSKASIALGRLGYIIDSKPESDKVNAVDADLSGDIEFKNVSFSYDGKKKVLDNVSFTVKAGTTLGILGGTGSGKSTLVQLLCRLYELDDNSGSITVSGIDVKDLKARSIRDNIGIVLQEPFLFSRTISENISISKENATKEEIEKAVKVACLDKAISEFKNGYDTVVGERGVTLSGGQKQRVAIARILLRGTPVIIFDDSLSAVDAETDSIIRHSIKQELSDSTVIIISHRISSIMHADNIIVLDHGRIAESGDHSKLLEMNGIYKRVFDLQHTDHIIDEEVE